jgi:hypothetical protein
MQKKTSKSWHQDVLKQIQLNQTIGVYKENNVPYGVTIIAYPKLWHILEIEKCTFSIAKTFMVLVI